MTASDRRALIIGGSIAGLFAALLLRRSGWHVDVFERTETELTDRGAGIVTHPELVEMLQAAGLDPSSDFGVKVTIRKTFDHAGRLVGETRRPQTVTSWERVFRMLRAALPSEHYHLGQELVRVEERTDRVIAHLASGTREGDILIGADGFRSTVRSQLLPEAKPVYAGYVAWRGLVSEDVLSKKTHDEIFEAMAFCLPPNEQMLGYPIAGTNNDLRPGHRRYNFVWYRPAGEDDDLRRLMTDRSGRTHSLSIPPPLVRSEIVDELRKAADHLLAPQFRETVRLAPQPRSSATRPFLPGRMWVRGSPRELRMLRHWPKLCDPTVISSGRSSPSRRRAWTSTGVLSNAGANSEPVWSRHPGKVDRRTNITRPRR
jgi:2-polyprenyl-6-methoxyphenol hydroxylase-like FAD-dependent oxidoreductase